MHLWGSLTGSVGQREHAVPFSESAALVFVFAAGEIRSELVFSAVIDRK